MKVFVNFCVAIHTFLPIICKKITYQNLCGMIQSKNIAVVKGDTDSSRVIIKKSDDVTKLDAVIDDGII